MKNKLIAEFMKLKESSVANKYWTEQSKEGFGMGELLELKYHTDWNDLMLVVDKIEATLDEDGYGNNVLIEASSCTILSGNDGSEVIGFTEGITKREATYSAVLEFINNQNR
ncbi:MAG: hypothetical protein ACTSQA_02120 [Candidatus Heimdallarchaeaceae archaeon]